MVRRAVRSAFFGLDPVWANRVVGALLLVVATSSLVMFALGIARHESANLFHFFIILFLFFAGARVLQRKSEWLKLARFVCSAVLFLIILTFTFGVAALIAFDPIHYPGEARDFSPFRLLTIAAVFVTALWSLVTLWRPDVVALYSREGSETEAPSSGEDAGSQYSTAALRHHLARLAVLAYAIGVGFFVLEYLSISPLDWAWLTDAELADLEQRHAAEIAAFEAKLSSRAIPRSEIGPVFSGARPYYAGSDLAASIVIVGERSGIWFYSEPTRPSLVSSSIDLLPPPRKGRETDALRVQRSYSPPGDATPLNELQQAEILVYTKRFQLEGEGGDDAYYHLLFWADD